MDVQKEIAFFDSFEADHGEYDVLAEESYQRILNVLRRELSPRPDMAVVDLGCGTGAFTRRLGGLGPAVTGVDISPRSIERARSQGGGRFLVGDICDSRLPTASFDCAVMSGVLHHVPTREERVRSLEEAFRILRPGGLFFSYDPNRHSPSMWLYRDPHSPLCSQAGKTENEVLLTRRELAGELEEAGFSCVSVRGLSGIASRYVEGKVARRLLPVYNRVYEPLIRFSGFEHVLGTFLVATAVRTS